MGILLHLLVGQGLPIMASRAGLTHQGQSAVSPTGTATQCAIHVRVPHLTTVPGDEGVPKSEVWNPPYLDEVVMVDNARLELSSSQGGMPRPWNPETTASVGTMGTEEGTQSNEWAKGTALRTKTDVCMELSLGYIADLQTVH